MRITAIPTTTTVTKVVPLYAAVKGALGMVPNLMQVLGNSPAALQGYLSLNGALAGGVLPAAVRERLALLVAEANGCDYCLAAHSLWSLKTLAGPVSILWPVVGVGVAV